MDGRRTVPREGPGNRIRLTGLLVPLHRSELRRQAGSCAARARRSAAAAAACARADLVSRDSTATVAVPLSGHRHAEPLTTSPDRGWAGGAPQVEHAGPPSGEGGLLDRPGVRGPAFFR